MDYLTTDVVAGDRKTENQTAGQDEVNVREKEIW